MVITKMATSVAACSGPGCVGCCCGALAPLNAAQKIVKKKIKKKSKK